MVFEAICTPCAVLSGEGGRWRNRLRKIAPELAL
jgi:hypothetical protein